MKHALQEYLGRPKKYENIDGTMEMLFGLLSLCPVVYQVAKPLLITCFLWANRFAGILVVYAVFALVLIPGYWARKAIKKHITYPRTGYVAYRRDAKSRAHMWLLAMLGGAASSAGFVLLIGFGQRHHAVSLTRLGLLSLYVAGYAYLFLRTSREHQWKWLVVLFLALGSLAISFSGWDRSRFEMAMFLFFGLTWLVSGGITLYLYVRCTRPAALEAE